MWKRFMCFMFDHKWKKRKMHLEDIPVFVPGRALIWPEKCTRCGKERRHG